MPQENIEWLGSRRTAFVHIGLAKAGSTFLQRAFFSKHPEIAYLGKNFVGKELSEAGRHVYRRPEKSYRGQTVASVFRAAMQEAQQGQAVVYSDETLTGNRFLSPDTCARRLVEIFGDFNVIFFIRNYRDWIASKYFFFLSRYFEETLNGFEPWLEKYSSQFEGGNVELKNVEVGNAISGIFYADIADTYEKITGGKVYVFLQEEFRVDSERILRTLSKLLDISPERVKPLLALDAGRQSKDRMYAKRAEFILGATAPLLRGDFEAFEAFLRPRIETVRKWKGPEIATLIYELLGKRESQLKRWTPVLRGLEAELELADGQKAEARIPEHIDRRLLPIALEQNRRIRDRYRLPLEQFGYPLPAESLAG